MAAKIKIKVKAKEKNGIVNAKLLVKHPMESGLRKDKSGQLIPVHHLKEVKVDYNGATIFLAEMGTGVSKDPFLAFSFKGKAGEEFTVDAIDSKDIVGSVKVKIK